jgi:hypothetical protein
MRLFGLAILPANRSFKMTIKSKASKAEVKAATEAVIALAAEAGAMASGIDSIKDAVSAITRDLHFRAVKIGRFSFKDESKCCPLAAAFINGRFPNADAVSDNMVSFTLSCFRKAVETGEDYTENPSRKAKAAKAETAAKAEADEADEAGEAGEAEDTAESETIICAIKRKSTLIKAASEIRKMAEAMRPIDGLNLLAAMLIDVVNELEGN